MFLSRDILSMGRSALSFCIGRVLVLLRGSVLPSKVLMQIALQLLPGPRFRGDDVDAHWVVVVSAPSLVGLVFILLKINYENEE